MPALRVRPRPRVTLHCGHPVVVRAVHQRVLCGRRRRRLAARPSTRPPRRCWPRSPRRASPMWTPPCAAARRGLRATSGVRCAAPTGPSTCTGSPASSRSAPANWPCWSRSTTASRSASRATWTSRWWPRTSSTTPAGPTSSRYAGFGPDPAPARAWPGRSSRGTSRCSCWPGRSRRRWPPATPWCSSRPRPRR